MYLRLIHSDDSLVNMLLAANQGYDRQLIVSLLTPYHHEVISNPSEQTRESFVSDAQIVSVLKKVVTGKVMGTNSQHYQGLGTYVPVLLVYDEASGTPDCVDVYPHEKRSEMFTIMRYLEGLTSAS